MRRRKKGPEPTSKIKKRAKYRLTEYPSSSFTRLVSRIVITNKLRRLGFNNFSLYFIDHHFCHAVTAAFCSGFKKAVVITLDGLGDGLSGTINQLSEGRLHPIASIPAKDSFGIFFEHVTNLMNMRELEDEGKVMALADYACPVPDSENPLLSFIAVDGLTVQSKFLSLKMYDELSRILWRYPSEQFAFMAQRTLEVKVLELVRNAIGHTGSDSICLAGGVFSNVKLNRLIRLLPDIKRCFVFPHMGDGGLPLGSALALNYQMTGEASVPLKSIFLGPEFDSKYIKGVLRQENLSYRKLGNTPQETARIISGGEIVLWFQGKAELGPRALGGRSILALPNSLSIKDRLNLILKKRVWYQPFCPSMLEEEADDLLEDYDGYPNHFMTMAYMVKAGKRDILQGVINIDGSCRPQIVTEDNSLFFRLLKETKKRTGVGVLLNTSFNVHGEPMVCSPIDAVKTFINKTDARFMVIGDYLVFR